MIPDRLTKKRREALLERRPSPEGNHLKWIPGDPQEDSNALNDVTIMYGI
jgi:hypothetical protein